MDFNMANNDNSLAVSPFDFQSFKKPRPVQAWIPLPGTKRKASSANIDDKFDPDCSPAPAKQFAVDEDIANEILRDGFYYDPSIPEVKVKVMESIAEDEEMEDGTSTVDRDPGDTRNDTDGGSMKIDGKECCDSVTHSMHESHSPKSSAHSLSMNGVSLILSNEIQETLAQKRLNADFLLHKRISEQIAQANSMALVLWKPPVVGPLDHPVLKPMKTNTSKPWKKSHLHSEQVPSLPNLIQLPSFPINSNLNLSQDHIVQDGDTVEMDISS